MSKLSKEEKKAMIKNWKETQRRDYILTKTEAEKLLNYLDNILENTPCDNTLRFTKNGCSTTFLREKLKAYLQKCVQWAATATVKC